MQLPGEDEADLLGSDDVCWVSFCLVACHNVPKKAFCLGVNRLPTFSDFRLIYKTRGHLCVFAVYIPD